MPAPAITALAKRFYAAELSVRGELEDKFKAALFSAEGAASGAWGLALVLAAWRRKKAGDSLDDLADTGVVSVVSQIQSFEGQFPGSFAKFLDTAERAADVGKIAAAGSYFSTTVRDLGAFVRPGLLAWLTSGGFAKVATALSRKLGGPSDAPKPALPPPSVNRTGDLDRRDFRAVTAPQSETAARKQVEAPTTSERDMQLAALIRAGWSADQAAQILAGPNAVPSGNGQGNGKPASDSKPSAAIVDGKTILERAGKGTPTESGDGDITAVSGAIKSGLDLLREILKQTTSSQDKAPSGGQKGNGSSKNPFTGGKEDPGGSMSDGGDDSSDPGSMPTDETDYSDSGPSSDPIEINDSSEVVD